MTSIVITVIIVTNYTQFRSSLRFLDKAEDYDDDDDDDDDVL